MCIRDRYIVGDTRGCRSRARVISVGFEDVITACSVISLLFHTMCILAPCPHGWRVAAGILDCA
eukprot:818521-Prymnesium_polylepis.1